MMPLGTDRGTQERNQQEEDSCRARLLVLQDEFRKMEEIVASMRRYKNKIDELKQENASMKFSYEANLQKYCSHISTLERDNVLVRNHLKKMEAQLHGKGDDRDKNKLLLERLRMMEADNSSLVLENEQQRQQYEKCLDEIANQVVQALLAQKTLREECLKLQSRVLDMEKQNRDLNVMFQERVMFASDSVLQIRSKRPGIQKLSSQSLCLHENMPPSYSSMSTTRPFLKANDTVTYESTFPRDDSSARLKLTRACLRRTRSMELEFCGSFVLGRRLLGQEDHLRPLRSDFLLSNKRYFIGSKLKHSTSADNISHFYRRKLNSQTEITLENIHQNKQTLWKNSSLPSHYVRASPAVFTDSLFSLNNLKDLTKSFKEGLSKDVNDSTRILASGLSRDKKKPNVNVPSKPLINSSPIAMESKHFSGKNQVIPYSSVRNFDEFSTVRLERPTSNETDQKYYYDYSDDDSDPRLAYKYPSTASTMSLNDVLSLDRETVLEDDVFSDGSAVTTSSQARLDYLPGSTVPPHIRESKISAIDSCSLRSQPSFLPLASSSLPFMKSNTSKHKTAKEVTQSKNCSAISLKDTFRTNQNKILQNTFIAKEKDGVEKSSFSETNNSETKGEILKNIVLNDVKSCKHFSELHYKSNDDDRLSYSSQKLRPKLQDVEHVHKGSNVQSSASSSIRGISLRSENANYADQTNNKYRIDAITNSRGKTQLVSNTDKLTQGTKLTRPGNLILAPEEKNFNFQGFSSTSSTSSEDKSPIKIFESKHNCDMRSSVIEVKKDGTVVHTMRAIEDSNTETSTSVSDSTCSPLESPSKIPLSLANEVIRMSKSAIKPGKENICKGASKASNATVGFLLHDQPVPQKARIEVVEDIIAGSDSINKTPLINPKNLSCHVQTKCQSSDSSFENLRVERSGSKDDGYSTMSSDIHPEVLEKFNDTLTRKPSAVEKDLLSYKSKNVITESSVLQNEVRRMSDPAINSQDRSFDLLSDPDSALEASAHSTAEMVTSSSSQVSTSSSEFPISPSCSSSVSKISKLFDGENKSIQFIHGGVASSVPTKEKENNAPNSSKASNVSVSPLSPNTFVPSCFQPPESPRRLTNEFQKSSTVRGPGNSSSLRKLSPVSPKPLNKSFSGFSLKQRPLTGIPIFASNKKSSETKLPDTTKQAEPSSALPNVNIRLSNESPSCDKKEIQIVTENIAKVQTETVNGCTIKSNSHSLSNEAELSKKGSELTARKISSSLARKEGASSSKPSKGNSSLVEGKKHLSGANNSVKNNLPKRAKQTQKKCIVMEKGNKDQAPAVSCVKETKASENNTNKNELTQKTSSLRSFKKSSDSKKTSTNAQRCGSASESKNINSNNTVIKDTAASIPANISTKARGKMSSIINNSTVRSSSCSVANVAKNYNSLPKQVSSSPLSVNENIKTSNDKVHNEPQDIPQHSHSNGCDESTITTNRPQKTIRIIMTNHSFQHMSDTENNGDEEPASSTVYENIIEETLGPIINAGDKSITNDNTDTFKSPLSIIDNICNLPQSNISTKRDIILKAHQKSSPIVVGQYENSNCSNSEELSATPAFIPSSCAHVNPSSILQRQHSNTSRTQTSHCSIEHGYKCSSLAQTTKQKKYERSNTTKCLYRTKSENDLFPKGNARSANDELFWPSLDRGTSLERSVSLDEVVPEKQMSWLFGQDYVNYHEESTQSERLHDPTNSQYRDAYPFALSPPSFYFSPRHNQFLHQIRPQRILSHDKHQYLHEDSSQNQAYLQRQYQNRSNRLVQPLQLDLSNVTEQDENESELGASRNSVLFSHTGMTSDESPGIDVEQQKAFKRQFYSLCKVDSNRSLLSSGRESREGLSHSSLNELINKNLEKAGSIDHETNISGRTDSWAKRHEDKGNSNIEFDEISKQIASLSKTVDELNQSLSSLTSGEFESSPRIIPQLSQYCDQERTSVAASVIDGFHWVDDEFFLASVNRGECVHGGVGVICDETSSNNSYHHQMYEQSFTEDASSEFYQFSLDGLQDPTQIMSGQDEIFATTLFNTVKESPQSKRKQQLNASGCDPGHEIHNHAQVENSFSSSIYCKNNKENGFEHEGGDKSEMNRTKKDKVIISGFDEHRSDQTDKLASSNNESDDSLASDIGLDRMMCQRLFHRKGAPVPATGSVFLDETKFTSSYNESMDTISALEFLNILPSFKNRKRRSNKSALKFPREETNKLSVQHPSFYEDSLNCSAENNHRQTRDVGIDAMSQSQISLQASFETVEQSLPETETFLNALGHDSSCNIFSKNSNKIFNDFHSNMVDEVDVEDDNNILLASDIMSSCDINVEESNSSQEPQLTILKRTNRHRKVNSSNNQYSCSNFMADLKSTSTATEAMPPKLPPRAPIINKNMSRMNLHRNVPPLPPPPACLNTERIHPPRNNSQDHKRQQSRYHFPYVNQHFPTKSPKYSKDIYPERSSSSNSYSENTQRTIPPPLPPRLYEASYEKKFRESTPPSRARQTSRNIEDRPHSFTNCSLRKPTVILPPHSSVSSSLATYPGPKNTPDKLHYFKRTPSADKQKDESSGSKIPRRRPKGRRGKTRSMTIAERPFLNVEGKLVTTPGGSTSKQWRDIDVANGLPLSDSSCEDESS